MTRGFLTLATGAENYYKLACNLLKSYKISSLNGSPFCILADRENKYTKLFDDVVVLENAKGSYTDKLQMILYTPYDETIFIDSDVIAYDDLNKYWSVFSGASDFSCFGQMLPLESEEGWFTNKKLGKYKNTIENVITLHGGIYYFKKGEISRKIYQIACDLAEHYDEYSFRGFLRPVDETLFAMAMAICGCQTVGIDRKPYFAWLQRVSLVEVEFFSRKLSFERVARSPHDKWVGQTDEGILIHFGNAHTVEPLYIIESNKVTFEFARRRGWNGFETVIYTFAGYIKAIVYRVIRYTQRKVIGYWRRGRKARNQ